MYVSECGSKNRFRGISVAREPKWDRNQASKELKWPLGLLRPSSGMLRECSPSAQVKAAAAHVQTLKRNQRIKKLSLTYVVSYSSSLSSSFSSAARFAKRFGLAFCGRSTDLSSDSYSTCASARRLASFLNSSICVAARSAMQMCFYMSKNTRNPYILELCLYYSTRPSDCALASFVKGSGPLPTTNRFQKFNPLVLTPHRGLRIS